MVRCAHCLQFLSQQVPHFRRSRLALGTRCLEPHHDKIRESSHTSIFAALAKNQVGRWWMEGLTMMVASFCLKGSRFLFPLRQSLPEQRQLLDEIYWTVSDATFWFLSSLSGCNDHWKSWPNRMLALGCVHPVLPPVVLHSLLLKVEQLVLDHCKAINFWLSESLL